MAETQHIVRSYSQELQQLRDLITEMGGLVESQVALAAEALATGDADIAARAVEQDPAVDELQRDAEQFIIRLLALRQPVAADLRQIVAALKIIGGLERIGDYAKNVAKRSMLLAQSTLPMSLSGLAHMARLVQESLKMVIDAFGEGDAAKATQVWQSDQAVDDLYNTIFRELITYMMEDPRNITACTHLLFVAKNLERIGDHSTNIAETIHYAVTGNSLPDARPKGSTTSSYNLVRPARDEAAGGED